MTQLQSSHGLIDPYAGMRQVPSFTLISSDIQEGEPLPAELYAEYAGGLNRSSQLSWSGFPQGQKALR